MAETSGPALTTAGALLLQQWLSPAYPTGAFAYSQGIEWAVRSGAIADAASLEGWLGDLMRHGPLRNDAILIAASWRATGPAERRALAELARALANSRQRRLETLQQGASFRAVTAAVQGGACAAALEALPEETPLPVALGTAAAACGLPLEPLLAAWLAAAAGALVSAAQRLGLLGQTAAQAALARLSALAATLAPGFATAGPEDLGSATVLGDLAVMQHETLDGRLFRS